MPRRHHTGHRYAVALMVTMLLAGPGLVAAHEPAYTQHFMLEECDGFASTGRHPFFILEPGFRLVLAGEEDGVDIGLTITVLHQTRMIEGIRTRVVEERETHDGALFEVSRNYFALCNRTNSVIYFGEDVDFGLDHSVGHPGCLFL